MVERTWVTLSGTGNVQYNPGWTALPKSIEITLSQEGTGVDSVVRFSTGWADGTLNRCDSIYGDSTGSRTEKSTTKCIIANSRVSGAITKTLEASLVSFDTISPGVYGFTLNQTILTESFQVSVRSDS